MFKQLALTLLCATALFAQEPPAQDAGAQGEPPKLAVLPLRGTINPNFSVDQDSMNQTVTTAFMATKKFTLVERSQMGMVLQEGKFQSSGLVDDATAAELGKQLGVKWVIVGSVKADNTKSKEVSGMKAGLSGLAVLTGFKRQEDATKDIDSDFWRANIKVTLRMVEVQTGKIAEVFESVGEARTMNQAKSSKEALEKMEAQLLAKIRDKYPQLGYVIQVVGPKELMIDLGSNHGFTKDDKVQVVSRDPDIIHPVTGATIRGKKNVLAVYKAKSVDTDTSVVVLEGSGNAAIKPGQVVEVLVKPAK